MHIDIQSPGIDHSNKLNQFITGLINDSDLGRTSKLVRAEVKLTDVKGAKVKENKKCQLVLHTPSQSPVVIQQSGRSFYQSAGLAIKRAKTTLRKSAKKHNESKRVSIKH